MERFNYPKKPESEYGFEEFKLTGKRIIELREALASVGASTAAHEEDAAVDVDNIEDVAPQQQVRPIEDMKEELRISLARYEVLKKRLGEESNPPE
jgi:hypothetical protein